MTSDSNAYVSVTTIKGRNRYNGGEIVVPPGPVVVKCEDGHYGDNVAAPSAVFWSP